MPFQDSENKQTIRRVWNAAVIEMRYLELGRPLSYFGLTGPEVLDLLDWQAWLGQRTAVEATGRTPDERVNAMETIGRLLMNVDVHGISSQFQLLRGDIESVILEGMDELGVKPVLADDEPAHRQSLSYDLANLDFVGGFGYRNQHGPAKRVAAIRRLFERQRGHDFLLLLTVNLRHTLGRDVEDFLAGLSSRLREEPCRKNLEWYLGRGAGASVHKLKATIPCWVRANAEPQQFRCNAYPPVLYEGHERAQMLHFMFDLHSCDGDLGAFSKQDDAQLIDLPLLEAANGALRLAPEQHPTFDKEMVRSLLDFLPADVREEILNSPAAPAPTRAGGNKNERKRARSG